MSTTTLKLKLVPEVLLSMDINPSCNTVFGDVEVVPGHTVDGSEIRRSPVDMVNIPLQYLQGLIHPRWCRISSINSKAV